MNNAEKFQEVFGYYATEMWAKPESEFLERINSEYVLTEEDILKFYYVESLDEYWIGRRLDNFYYAEWNDRLGFVWTHSRYLPWGEHVVAPDTLWKEHTYPSEPKEIPFNEWLQGFLQKEHHALNELPPVEPVAKNATPTDDMGEVSDGYHTFNQLYHQRAVLFATIVNQNKDKAWKSWKHEDGQFCFDKDGEWFIAGIDTPDGSYTYHYEKKYWDMFDCEELERGKHWDGHTEDDVTRLLSLPPVEPVAKNATPTDDCISRQATIEAIEKAYCNPCKERGDDYNEVRCRACNFDDAINQIDAVPPLEPKRPEGER